MTWLLVIVAGIFETGFAVLLKQGRGITRLTPTVGFAICALISFGLLTIALRKLEVGPAYAVWTGIGAAGAALVGVAVLGESVPDPTLSANGGGLPYSRNRDACAPSCAGSPRWPALAARRQAWGG